MGRIAVAIVVLAALAAPARADDEEDARSAMGRGVTALAAHQYQAALDEFERATQLVPAAPGPYRYAGEALERLERWADAVARYRRYLEVWPAASDAADVRGRIARIEAAHLRGVVAITCQAGAAVTIDGASIGTTPLEPVPLTAGEHDVQVSAGGYLPWRTTVSVSAGAEVVVTCNLAALPPAAPPPPVVERKKPARRQPSRPWYRRPWVWAVAAGSAAVIAGGTVGYFAMTDLPDTDGGDFPYPP
jgi:tetratricopeptide (TPR) repeat protein